LSSSARARATLSSGNAGISIQVIEPNREMQRLLRGMLSGFGLRSIKIYSDTERAGTAMLSDPPELILLDWDTEPYNGADF
jgi:CheY-like chemotaxis protein